MFGLRNLCNIMEIFRSWYRNARPAALGQSLLPAVLAVVLAVGTADFSIVCSLLALVGVATAHLAFNLTDDYFDYLADMHEDRERAVRKGFRAMTVKYPYFLDGSATLKSARAAILSFLACATCCAAIIFYLRGLNWLMVSVILATAFLGTFYSAPPLKLAYRGLGELVIGVIFGPLIMTGVYIAAAGSFSVSVLWVSFPVGLLVLNILFTHSYIDKASDAESGKMTLARLLSSDRLNLAAAYTFNLLPFALIVAAVCLGRLSAAYLAVLVAMPRALWLCRSLWKFSKGDAAVPYSPPRWLGPMRPWGPVREKGADWFLMRWLCARNTVTAFCIVLAVVRLCLLIFE